jgi:hypothetical protein
VNYGVSDGLQASEFNLGAWYQSTSGELFFGGINGFNAFMPDRLRHVSQAPPVVLTAVNVGHPPLAGPPTRPARSASASATRCSASSSRPSTTPRPSATVLVQARGLRSRLGAPQRRRSVHLHEPQPGHYTFRLRGANSDGRWNEQGLAVAVDVAAPPWATPWAFTGYSCSWWARCSAWRASSSASSTREAEYARVLEFRVQERTRELSSASASWRRRTTSWPRPASRTR